MTRALLETVHSLYLQALARLPAGELCSRFHRSQLRAGHCYGPLDPVSNIIVNTIWYDAEFPRTPELELDMVSTRSLHRIEARSMYGLVSFLCTRYHHLDSHGSTTPRAACSTPMPACCLPTQTSMPATLLPAPEQGSREVWEEHKDEAQDARSPEWRKPSRPLPSLRGTPTRMLR